jgi:NAD+ synthase (glutamine-hydrolysing)
MKNKAKIALAAPKIRLACPEYNAKLFADCARSANLSSADIILFPELSLTGATCGNLFRQEVLTEAALSALLLFMEETRELEVMSFVGLPMKIDGEVYNCVAAVSEGEILGITASGHESGAFSAIPKSGKMINVNGANVRVGRDLIYTDDATRANIFVKIGEDNAFSADGVNIILNPAAMTEYIGLSAKRRSYAKAVSCGMNVPFVICGAGEGESGTDGIYAAPRLVAQGENVTEEAELFSEEILYSTVDLSPAKKYSSPKAVANEPVMRSPFIPTDVGERDAACKLALEIQSRALAERAKRAYASTLVLGVSGGLDSTLAVLVAAGAMDILGRDRKNVIAITMPCFGTTERTKSNALELASQLGCSVRTIDIKAAVNQHFADISHDPQKFDVVYENSQARERTQILMDIANAEGGMVVGTGDLSELALGFATYNGDHMSMYCVNGSVPKTLMRAIIAYAASLAMSGGNETLANTLTDIIETPVSPELLPVEGGENKQHTESIVGPYELHDFFLYYTVKFGYSPSKILAMAVSVFPEYERAEIQKYLNVFVRRFFSQQFKRSCLPDGPRVTEISLSPRTSWTMPSDVSSEIWQNNLALGVNNE